MQSHKNDQPKINAWFLFMPFIYSFLLFSFLLSFFLSSSNNAGIDSSFVSQCPPVEKQTRANS